MSKESFKLFIRKHPELIGFVNNGDMTWQKFYDIYDLYGEDKNAWSSYFKKSNNLSDDGEFKFSQFIKYLKNVDMDTLQKGVSGVQKAINLIQQLGIGNSSSQVTDTYEPRPLYKSFED